MKKLLIAILRNDPSLILPFIVAFAFVIVFFCGGVALVVQTVNGCK